MFDATAGRRQTFYIENLGCAKNQVDAELMVGTLVASDRVRVDDPSDADVIIVNSCGFIEPAIVESVEVATDFRRRYPRAHLVFTGCMAQRFGDAVAQEMPELTTVLGNREPAAIAAAIDELAGANAEPNPGATAERSRVVLPSTPAAGPDGAYDHGRYDPRPEIFSSPGSAYVKVAEGCNNRCAFCAIPQIRGPLRSRSIASVTKEVAALLERGIKEINLVAQDLGAFGTDRGSPEAIALLESLLSLPGEFYLRPLYVYPEHFPLKILELCKADPRLVCYFDIPMQHGSDRVLKAMGRRGSFDSYARLVAAIRDTLPEAVVRTSLIVGFPGEEQEDVEATAHLLETLALDWVGVFSYSREEGTPAYDRRPQVPRAIAEKRRRLLEETQFPLTCSRLDRQVGTEQWVLLEEKNGDHELYLGRGYGQAPEVDGSIVFHGRPAGHTTAGTSDAAGHTTAATSDAAGSPRLGTVGAENDIRVGTVARARIVKRNGIDLEAVEIGASKTGLQSRATAL